MDRIIALPVRSLLFVLNELIECDLSYNLQEGV